MAKKQAKPAKVKEERNPLLDTSLIELFARLVELCNNDKMTALSKLEARAEIDRRTLAPLHNGSGGTTRCRASTQERIRSALSGLKAEAEAQQKEPKRRDEYHGAPNPVLRWARRDDSITDLLEAHLIGGKMRIVQLTAGGGEGKSALVRMWLTRLEHESVRGTFWWNFFCNPQVDAFVAALLDYLPRRPDEDQPTNLLTEQVNRIVRRLGHADYVVVLDGFEEMLASGSGDPLAPIRDRDLRFLLLEQAKNTKSLFILTSRVGVAELHSERTCTRHEVKSLSGPVSRDLLAELGVKGTAEELAAAATETCGGHALTLSLLGTFLVRHHRGEIKALAELNLPGREATTRQRIEALLRLHEGRPGANLLRGVVMPLFSTLRKPFSRAFGVSLLADAASCPALASLFGRHDAPPGGSDARLGEMVRDRLLTQGGVDLLIHDLIRDYYSVRFQEHDESVRAAWHKLVRDQYLKSPAPGSPTLPAHLQPAVEAVHHGCEAKEYNTAWQLTMERVAYGDRFLFVLGMGQWQSGLDLLCGFFAHRDTGGMPLIDGSLQQAFLLTQVGYAVLTLGQRDAGLALMERGANAAAIHKEAPDPFGVVAFALCTLAEGHLLQGNIYLAEKTAEEAHSLAEAQKSAMGVRRALVYRAWGRWLRGDFDGVGQALGEGRKSDEQFPAVVDVHGVGRMLAGLHLIEAGQVKEARQLLRQTAEGCVQKRYWNQASRCRRLLGGLGSKGQAKQHFMKAVELAKRSSFHPPLVEALTALGDHYLDAKDDASAEKSIDEAILLASRYGLTLHLIDARISQVRLMRSRQEAEAADELSARLRRECELLGYGWGQRRLSNSQP